MVTETSKVHSFLVALADGLAARGGLTGVQVASGPLGGDSDRHESIQFVDIDMGQEWGMIGNKRREEKFTASGLVWVMRAGKNEATIRTVRERLFEMLGEVEDFLRVDPTIGNVVRVAHLKTGRLEQGANEEGRWAQFDFEIEVTTSLTSS